MTALIFSQGKKKKILPAFFTELKSRLISLTAKSTWKGAIYQPNRICQWDKIKPQQGSALPVHEG